MPDSQNDPDSTNILWVWDNFDSQGMFYLVRSFEHKNILAHLIIINMINHSFSVVMSKLDWEGLESMSFRHIILDTCLELIIGECCSTDSFEFIITESCLQKIA